MRRILFVKTSSLGDVVHHCPAVSDAARKLPGVAIDWVVEEGFAEVAAMHPAVRRAIPVAARRWRRAPFAAATWREVRAFRRALAAERYDAVVDSQSLIKSALMASLAQGVKHGMDRDSAREPLAARFYDVRHAVARGAHAVERNRRLAALALGYEADGAPDYGLRAGASAPSAPYAVFLTMTSRADKLWPEAAWIELGKALELKVLLPWGSDAERARAERIGASIGDALVPAQMSVSALAALFAGARCVAGLDTGLTHLAAALGARTAGIYCGSDPGLTGLYGARHASSLGRRGASPSVPEVLKALA